MSFHPQTPQSPSQYSPGNSNTTTDMTSSMTMTNNSSGMTPTLPTPAHSVNGSSLPSEMALDGGSLLSAGADDMTGYHKRKRAIDDIGGSDREQKKVQIEDRRLGIENLHLDVGAKYLLCKTPHTTSSVYCSEDLFEKFGLTGLAAEVARVLPNGEKNAIRKTYKGHIKKLGVSGHFDSVKEEWNRPDGMISLLKYPQEEWMVQQVRGKEVENGLSRETLARMDKAFSFAKGVVPKSTWDSSVLGDLAPGALGKAEKQSASARPTAPNTPVPSAAPGVVPRLKQTSLAPDAARPRRSIKKRSYGDSSFEGYGDGFPDDDMGPGSGYSTGEGEMGAAAQKRRKKNPTGGQTPSYSQVRQPSYGPGMVGA